MKKTNENIGLRILAFFIDYFIIMLVSMIPVALSVKVLSDQPENMFYIFYIVLLICFTLFLLKDIANGISIGKWTVGLAVKEYNSENKPKKIKLITRNLFTFLWPIEVLMIIFGKDERKLGDKLAKTKVYRVSNKINIKKVVVVIVLILIFFISSIFLITIESIKGSRSYKVAIETIEKDRSIQEVVGEIEGYGLIPSGGVSIVNGYGEANFTIKVKGKNDDVKVYVYLNKAQHREWEAKEVYYDK